MVVADVCRVSVRALSQSVASDLVLPSGVEVGEVLPCVVELVGERPEATERWTLSRIDGSWLDESMTLHENGVRDGDVLRLGIDDQTSEPRFNDVCHYVVAETESSDHGNSSPRLMGAIALVWSTGVGATALVWPAHSAAIVRAVVAAVLAVAAATGAILTSRLDTEWLPTLALGGTAIVFGSVAGFLMVPGGPAPPNLFLAAAVCSAMSIVLHHGTSPGTSLYIAIATLSTMWAVTAAVVAVWPAPAATVGAVLAAVSLAMLGVAARITILLTGLTPRVPSTSDAPTGDEEVSAGTCVARAERGRRTLTGLLVGFSLSTASGAVLIAVDRQEEYALRYAAFTGVVSVVLILRIAQQVGMARSTSVLVAGLISATATFTLAASTGLQYGPWLCLLTVILCAGALLLSGTDVGSRLSPGARRGIEVVDYLALASIVPLACWVGGLFGFVRGWSLS